MTEYRKLSVGVLVSDNADLSSPSVLASVAYEPTAVGQSARYTVSAATGGTTVDLGAFASVAQVVVKNKDTTNYVTLVTTTDSGSASNSHKIAAGKLEVLSDVKVSGDLLLTANTAACECEVIILGA